MPNPTNYVVQRTVDDMESFLRIEKFYATRVWVGRAEHGTQFTLGEAFAIVTALSLESPNESFVASEA